MVSEIGKYIVSFFFDDKGLQLSLLTFICFSFFLKFSMKLEKIQIFILQFNFRTPPA